MTVSTDPVHVAQRTFRALLGALSHPGRFVPLEEAADAPPPWTPALAAAALALLDGDVAVWLADSDAAAATWLIGQTGCRIARDPGAAHFAVLFDGRAAVPIERWNPGTAEEPQTSTTLLVGVEALEPHGTIVLRGPGIPETVALGVRGINAAFWPAWEVNAARYPLGVDAFLLDARGVVGLSRTTRIVAS